MATNAPAQVLNAIQQLQVEVQRQATQLQQQTTQLQQLQQLSIQVQQQHDEIVGLKAQIQLLSTRPSNDSRKRPCLPDPEKFNGQSYKFDT